ncbi:uncharacterized protein LOC114674435 [Macaca mulatta]
MVYMARRFHTTAGPRPDPAPAPGLALNGRRALRGGGGPVTRPRPLKGPHGLGPTPGHAAEAALGPFGKLAGGGGAGSNPAPAPGGARPRRTKRPAARERPCCLEASLLEHEKQQPDSRFGPATRGDSACASVRA